MNYFKKSKIRWLPCCLIFFIHSCTQNTPYKELRMTSQDSLDKKAFIRRAFDSIYLMRQLIRNGDIITRTGNDFTSQSLRSLNQRNQQYSHCGIASIENDTVFVYHALGGEFNPDQKIKRERFVDFSQPYENNGIGIFRFSPTEFPAKNAVAVAKELYFRGIQFDMDFDLKTNDKMYCAEFVYKTFLLAYPGRIKFSTSHINKFEFIGVDDLFLHPLCHSMKEIVYK
ncbi:YiiX/YebB-like N1pC/P60 family cysteine hydrolase [Ferruginibacter sp. HRS2-29]|uniref:YiiX/YebB-like N1pC/P60 family cysteine hydrolase n=1 Tax=Ferruginibacter sp. HRS2-29 TaxID=2487334 RepID=UPI0020CF364B|nr:YiiX/YebB-like N1pC/P60 family cysteine hydrolase [Ferruginibacter sp. HRS2-29]MCP9749451.1 hypothetical protein [Ferruginibacter sp. HRS2-29]